MILLTNRLRISTGFSDTLSVVLNDLPKTARGLKIAFLDPQERNKKTTLLKGTVSPD
jgi:hypothetical protein